MHIEYQVGTNPSKVKRGLEEAKDNQSPSQSQQKSANGLNLEEVKKKLKDIFIYYASYGDRMNTTNLKS